jgi:hypothetical protein
MKAGGIVMVVFGALLLAASIFFGIFSVKNAGSAERLRESVGPKGGGPRADRARSAAVVIISLRTARPHPPTPCRDEPLLSRGVAPRRWS